MLLSHLSKRTKVILIFCAILAVGSHLSAGRWTSSQQSIPLALGGTADNNVYEIIDNSESPNEFSEEGLQSLTSTNLIEPVDEVKPAPTKNSHLRKLCDAQKWTEGLWLSCHSNCGRDGESICGGLNNARNRFQSCLRLAIDAGAGIVFPTMAARNEETLKPHDGSRQVCTGHLWNTRQLAQNLKEECPQLKVRFCGNTTGLGPKIISHGKRHFNGRPHTTGTFRTNVNIDLKQNNITSVNTSYPVRIDYSDAMFSWNYSASNELQTIRKDLFRILPYNAGILQLGENILDLATQFRPFVGVHLRGESDWPPQFGTRDQQIDAYVSALETLPRDEDVDIQNIYVSCGDKEAIQSFRERLAPLHYIVHDKWTLVENHPKLLAKMGKLNFDQRAILEYKTLTAADYFIGPGLSSMSLLVAFDRTVDEKSDYFSSFVHNNSTRATSLNRKYPISPIMKGNKKTRLFMLSGPDIMDRYP